MLLQASRLHYEEEHSMPPTDATAKLQSIKHDPRDPNPWLALYLDTSIPLHTAAKANFLVDVASTSRQWFLPMIRPFCRLTIAGFKVLKIFMPRLPHVVVAACTTRSTGG